MVVGAMVGAVLLLPDPLLGLKELLFVSFGRMVDLDPFGLLLPFPKVEGDTAALAVLPRMPTAARRTWIFIVWCLVGCLSCLVNVIFKRTAEHVSDSKNSKMGWPYK